MGQSGFSESASVSFTGWVFNARESVPAPIPHVPKREIKVLTCFAYPIVELVYSFLASAIERLDKLLDRYLAFYDLNVLTSDLRSM